MEPLLKLLERRLPGEALASLGVDMGEKQIDLMLGHEIEAFSFFYDITDQGMVAFASAFLVRGIGVAEEDATADFTLRRGLELRDVLELRAIVGEQAIEEETVGLHELFDEAM